MAETAVMSPCSSCDAEIPLRSDITGFRKMIRVPQLAAGVAAGEAALQRVTRSAASRVRGHIVQRSRFRSADRVVVLRRSKPIWAMTTRTRLRQWAQQDQAAEEARAAGG